MKCLLKLIFFTCLQYSTCINNIKNFNIKSMQFNLNKDSLWISHPLKRTSFAELSKLIPETHKLTMCKIFENDKPDYRLFYNFFEVRTPFFKGNRLEVVTLAKSTIDQTISFIILDCFTNAMSWDPIDGIRESNSKFQIKNTNSEYNIAINSYKYKNNNEKYKDNNNQYKENNEYKDDNENDYIFNLKSLKSTIQKNVLTDFSINPNRVCYFKNYPVGYKLIFNDNQIDKKVLLLKNVEFETNIYNKYIKELEHVFIYPQIMNFKVLF